MDDTPTIMTPAEALAAAAEIIPGGFAGIGRLFGISRNAVSQWPQCPPERVIAIERATEGRITRHQLRPDIYPEDVPSPAQPSTEAA